MAEDIGRLNLYEIAYSVASELHHMPSTGIIGHELDWSREALFIGHGSLMETVLSLFSTQNDGAELRERLRVAIVNFNHTRKKP